MKAEILKALWDVIEKKKAGTLSWVDIAKLVNLILSSVIEASDPSEPVFGSTAATVAACEDDDCDCTDLLEAFDEFGKATGHKIEFPMAAASADGEPMKGPALSIILKIALPILLEYLKNRI